jgi:predicted phage tail component-like protein
MGTYFTFGGVSSEQFGIIVQRVSRPLMPATRDRRLVIATRHGEWDFGSYMTSREINLNCAVVGDSRALLMSSLESIAGWLNPMAGYKQLIISDQADRYWNARYSGASDVDLLMAKGEFILPFIVTDVSPHALTPDSDEGDVADGAGLAVSNAGLQAVPFKLTATLAAGEDPFELFLPAGIGGAPPTGVSEVTFSIGSAWMKYAGGIWPGVTLEIDTAGHTCKLDGESVLNKWSGTWLTLPVGSNSLVQDNPEGLVLHLLVEFSPVLV